MGDRISMSISVGLLDESLNQGPLALLLRRQYEFPFVIDIVQCSFFIFIFITEQILQKNILYGSIKSSIGYCFHGLHYVWIDFSISNFTVINSKWTDMD